MNIANNTDLGFPYSEWIKRVNSDQEFPFNAFNICAGVSTILPAINFGSDVASNAIISISNGTLVSSYFISTGCIRLKRRRSGPLLHCRWSLGRLGAPLNELTLAFLAVGFVLSFSPETPLLSDPTWASDMNWACLICVATILLAGGYDWAGGRRIYVPPVSLIKRE